MVKKISPALIVIIILSVAFTILLLSLSRYRGKSTPESIRITPTPTAADSTYTPADCPSNGWIDCMPVVAPGKRPFCEDNFIRWAQVNCPGFQGIAY